MVSQPRDPLGDGTPAGRATPAWLVRAASVVLLVTFTLAIVALLLAVTWRAMMWLVS